MGILVLLTAFLLAASANPIGNSREDSVGTASHNEAEDVRSTNDESQLSSGDDTTSDTNEAPTSIDEVSNSTEHTGDGSNENSQNGDVDNEDTRNEDVHSGDVGDENSDNGDTTNSNSNNEDVNNEDANNGNSPNGAVHTSVVSTASTTPTTSPTGEDSETKNITLPADADPLDCRARNPKTHIYLACQFSCEGDMMELAQDNATCLFNYTENPADENNSTRPNWNETGVCQKGDCVRTPSEVTEATSPASSPTGTTTAAGVTEKASEAVTPETTTSPESSSPETTTSAMNSEMDSRTTAQPSPPVPDFSPVAMP